MAEIKRNTEPRPSLLIAFVLLGWAVSIANSKQWIDDWGAGIFIANVAIGWIIARGWYLRYE